jgi:hypothetical protein
LSIGRNWHAIGFTQSYRIVDTFLSFFEDCHDFSLSFHKQKQSYYKIPPNINAAARAVKILTNR